jgi:ATP-dependent DNA helicase RecQ
VDDTLKSLVDTLLLTPEPDYADLTRVLRHRQRQLQDEALILNQVLLRLTLALTPTHNDGTIAIGDAVVLLRQLIRAGGPITLNPSWWEKLRHQAEFSRLVGYPDGPAQIQVLALPWESTEIEHSDHIDRFERRTDDETCLGDGMVYAMSKAAKLNWTTYRSGAQKAAVDCWTFAPPGATMLGILPTGGGKSLCTMLPPWFGSRGGRRSQGTTLVVVPTVALALDQEKQAGRFFGQAVGELSKPISRTGDTSADERLAIEAALRDGRMPIIYTSPESLLNSRLHDVCLKAAADGLITRFVIDEAHLIASWGVGFRPEFQQLAAYRRRLLEVSGGRLRTLLLSATISESSRSMIENLFAERGKLIVVQANRLRPEIGYWFKRVHAESSRQRFLLEALRFLPRPLILYVTRPVQAKRWARTLLSQGYRRVGEFTGDTDADMRRLMIKRWDENEIDIMVATSAFGLGVDKSDVRAIVHATLPENIDRFYQEVGRSGRDGYSAVSLLCAVYNQQQDNDVDLVFGLQPRLITLDKALPRWRSMIEHAVAENDVRWLDRDVTPHGRHDMRHSERNREWNDHLLLLMQRARLIEVVDAPPPMVGEAGALLNRIPVRVLDDAVFNAPAMALAKIDPFREEEKEDAQRAARGIVDLVSTYAGGQGEVCLATEFAQLYADVQDACGGCPVCRELNELPYCPPLRFTVDYPHALQRTVESGIPIEPTLGNRLGAWRILNVTWRGPRTLAGLQPCVELIPDLVRSGVQQVVYPEELLDEPAVRARIVAALAESDPLRPPQIHRLIPEAWLVEDDYPLFPLATLVIYPTDESRADRLFRSLRRLRQDGIELPGLINIIPDGLHLASEGKRFVEHVDGLTESIERLQELLQGSQEMPAFF